MGKKIQRLILFCLVISFVLSGCGKDSAFDFFVGGQPDFIGDHKFIPGLNIFGIIRPDSIQSVPMTFVHVEKAIPAISDESVTFSVDHVHVVFYKIENNIIIDSIILSYSNPHALFPLPEFRPGRFTPKAGEHYKIKCSAKDLPDLTSETSVPEVPQIAGDSVITSGNKIQFSIKNDSSAALYDAYLDVNGTIYSQRIVRENNGKTNVKIEVNENIKSGAQLTLYAYDIKLSEYFAAANLSFKPNTFRPPFSNVQNGYGCFGSMNILVKKLK
jgi:hypothetical protein